MTFESERIIPEPGPTPRQLFALASVGIAVASEEGRLKTYGKWRRTHSWIHDLYDDYVDDTDSGREVHIRHRVAGHIRREFCDVVVDEESREYESMTRQWRLRLFDVYWVALGGNRENAVRSIYSFAWNDEHTLAAKKMTELKFSDDLDKDQTLQDDILNFTLSDYAVPLLGTENELRQVTDVDCILLAESLQEYYARRAQRTTA